MNIVNSRYIQWWHWILIPIFTSTGIGLSAFFFLISLPNRANCDVNISSRDAAAVIYCANQTVDAENPYKLVQAIDLVNQIPKGNPLRNNSDRLISQWLKALLRVSEKSFHTGDFPKAVNALEDLPEDIPNYATVEEKIQAWQAIWQKGEDIYQEAKAIVKQEEPDREKWYKALQKAKKLRKLNNEYWASNKYYELIRHIQATREQAEKIEKEEKIAQQEREKEEKAQLQAQNDNLDNWNLFDTNQVREDFMQLGKARKLAESGKINDMRTAIVEASLIISDAHYQEAQSLINNLENKIELAEDKLYLKNARNIAQNGGRLSLQSAINEASLIRKGSAIYPQAKQQIKQWESLIAKLGQGQTRLSGASQINVEQKPSNDSLGVEDFASDNPSTSSDFAPKPVLNSQDNMPKYTTFTPSFQEMNIEETELEAIDR